jgi:transposase
MTKKEFNKGEVLRLLEKKQLTREQAAESLGIGLRQIDRLKNRLQEKGIGGLAHSNRGRPGNRKLKEGLKLKIVNTVKEHYTDFGPTLAAEKLLKNHQLQISRETLRLLMKNEGLWKGKKRKKPRYHPRRPRRGCCGEMLQGDGSEHDWFEGRRDRCVLVAVIDDATNRAYGRFFESETTEAYAEVMRIYLKKYGQPLSLYVDKDSIFRINRKVLSADAKGETQFERMMKELGIRLICAHSPEAKGRIERLFGTLQDRLVKEMRLLALNTTEEANLYLEKHFWDEFNNRWNCKAADPKDLHRKSPPDAILNRVFTIRHDRKISKSLDFSYNGVLYQIQTKTPHRLARKPVIIFERFDGSFWVEADGKQLVITSYKESPQTLPIQDSKTINAFLNKRRPLSIIERRRKGINCPG